VPGERVEGTVGQTGKRKTGSFVGTEGATSAAPRSSLDEDVGWRLAREMRDGRRPAFREIVREYSGFLKAFVLKVGWHRLGFAHLEDIVQETWYAALRSIRSGNPLPTHRSFRSWLAGMCRNALRHRWLRPESQGSDLDRLASAMEYPEEIVLTAELHEAINRCASKLEEKLREVHRYLYLDELNFSQAATQIGCSEANVRQKLEPRMLAKMKACLARSGFSEPRRVA
jgi:RNA polymerase sigma factor (sigma-70 family)